MCRHDTNALVSAVRRYKFKRSKGVNIDILNKNFIMVHLKDLNVSFVFLHKLRILSLRKNTSMY